MVLHDDVVHQILQRLPVISLLRFKLVCRKWRAMIESNDFIKQHLHHHYHDPNLKGENHSLIRIVGCKESPFTFPLISIDGFEEPYARVQLDLSHLHKYYPLNISDAVSYNGIICFSFVNCARQYCICIWNPATRQSRVLPQSRAFVLGMETSLGFGFDVKSNDYKVVRLCRKINSNEGRVKMYSSNTDSWSSVTSAFPFRFRRASTIPFNNGTSFFWSGYNNKMVICFDFSSEKLRSIPFPDVGDHGPRCAIVSSDKIACVSRRHGGQTTIWVLNGYGSANESWVELYTVDPLSTILRGGKLAKWLFMNENCLFFKALDCSGGNSVKDAIEMVCGYNVVTKELKILSTVAVAAHVEIDFKKRSSNDLTISWDHVGEILVDFKESLLSVG